MFFSFKFFRYVHVWKLSSKHWQCLQLKSKGVREDLLLLRKHFDLLDVSHQINHTTLENLTTLGPHADAKIISYAELADQCQIIRKIQSPVYLDYKPTTDPRNGKTWISFLKYFLICPCVEVVK